MSLAQPLPTLSMLLARSTLLPGQHELDQIKKQLTQLGVNQRGWRLLVTFGDALYEPLMGTLIHERRPLAAVEQLVAYVKLLQGCEMDVLPPPEFARAWGVMRYPDRDGSHLGDVPVALFRAAWIEAVRIQYAKASLTTFVNEELPATIYWFLDTEQSWGLDHNQMKQAWSGHRMRFLGWQERCRHSFDHVREWLPILEKSCVFRGIHAVELCSSDAIVEEGRIMRHCVAESIDACRAGIYHVFSLRDPCTRERYATLGLLLSDYGREWRIEDCKMQGNEKPDDYLMDVAADVAESCTQALRKSREKHAVEKTEAGRTQSDLFEAPQCVSA